MKAIDIIIGSLLVVLITITLVYTVKLDQHNKQLIKTVKPLLEERDTTSSLRNYEVLTDSITNVCLKWVNGDEYDK